MLSKKQRADLEKITIRALSAATGLREPMSMDVKERIADSSTYDRYYGNPRLAAMSLSCRSEDVKRCWMAVGHKPDYNGSSAEAHPNVSTGFRRYR